MNKKIVITALLALMLCSGCAGKSNELKTGNMLQWQQTAVVISDEIKNSAVKVVSGTVESIVGNEVTLLISSESEGLVSEKPSETAEGEIPDHSRAVNGRQQRMEKTDAERPQRRQREEISNNFEKSGSNPVSTTKTQKYILPVGMKMGIKDFSSVSAGNTLRIYFGIHPNDGSEIITAVEVISGRR